MDLVGRNRENHKYAVYTRWKQGRFFLLRSVGNVEKSNVSTEAFSRAYTGRCILVSAEPIETPQNARLLGGGLQAKEGTLWEMLVYGLLGAVLAGLAYWWKA